MQVAAGRFPIEKNVTVILVAEASSTRQEMEQFIRAARAIRPDVKVVIQSGKTRKVFAENLSFCFCEICPRASLTFYLMVAGCGGHACHLDSAPESLLGFGHYKWLKGRRIYLQNRSSINAVMRNVSLSIGMVAHQMLRAQDVGSRATTGILATIAMLRQCDNVTLYGFGPPLRGTGSAPFHFYDVSITASNAHPHRTNRQQFHLSRPCL